MAPSDPEVIVDQVGNLSAAKETVLFLGLLFLQTDSPFELGIMDDLFSAEAILASSTSKFGIEIPRVDDEDLNSSTESTNSTSLIHCIASVGNCEQVHSSVLNLIFQQAKVAGVGNLSKWRIRILQSLLVCPIILWRVSSTEDDWIFGWRSRLASQIFILFWSFTLLRCRHMKRLLNDFSPGIQFLRMRSCRGSLWIYKNVSRYTRCIPNVWQPFFAARRYEWRPQQSFRNRMFREWHWLTGNVREFPLRTDSASWKSIESFIQFTSFCNSCNLPDNSIIVFCSSMSFRLACMSKVELWNFRNSSISVKFCWWTSRKSFCWRHNSSCRIWRPCSARAAWSSWWEIFSQHSAMIICLCSSNKVLICALELLSPTGFPVLSTIFSAWVIAGNW